MHTNSKKWRAIKELLKTVKEESGKTGLKLKIQKTKILASGAHHLMENILRKSRSSDRFYFWAPKSLQTVTAAVKWKHACSLYTYDWSMLIFGRKQHNCIAIILLLKNK